MITDINIKNIKVSIFTTDNLSISTDIESDFNIQLILLIIFKEIKNGTGN